ncbi:hypothetical protein [Albibacterium sp.]|uniref:hypothetical protein n=1 Tax=Albibacterium sp. TaxID=2952885 RepID=UPI002CB99CE5|nr:hypothetical protein [Albibacterium sp.]HUH19387.1 hypothetical protein [Albibacterium sp.]
MKVLENKIRIIVGELVEFISNYRAIILSALLIVFVFLGYMGRNSSFFTFPLNAGVWGTLSDWIMVIVTAFTVFYLIKSFSAQRASNSIQNETLIEQQKITEIEQFIFKEKVKPIFELKIGDHGMNIDEINEEATATYSFNFFVHNGAAKDIHIEDYLFDHNGSSNNMIGASSRNELYPGMNFSSMPSEYKQHKINNNQDVHYIFRFSFIITYCDVLDNYYEQNVIFYSDSNDLKNIHQGGPKPINKPLDK